jgi:hypothetical protein
VPYRTLTNFLERFKQGVPNRIGTDLMRSMSGGVRSQLFTSLRSFGLINDGGVPQERMRKLCAAEGADRQAVLKDLIGSCYPYLFKDGFEFSTTTMSLLREAIQEHTTANGETITRCIAFLKDAATDAGITVSPFLQESKPRPTGVRPKRANAARSQERAANRAEEHTPEETLPRGPGSIPAQESLLLWGLFRRLPKPGTPWTKQDRDQWTQTLGNVLSLEYPEK